MHSLLAIKAILSQSLSYFKSIFLIPGLPNFQRQIWPSVSYHWIISAPHGEVLDAINSSYPSTDLWFSLLPFLASAVTTLWLLVPRFTVFVPDIVRHCCQLSSDSPCITFRWSTNCSVPCLLNARCTCLLQTTTLAGWVPP